MIIEAKVTNGEIIRKLEAKVNQTVWLIKRITNRHEGMKEASVMTIILSFVISQMAYMAAYHRWYATEKKELDGLIRKVYKQAIGLVLSTSMEKLLQLGLHNTLEKLIEGQRIAQYEHLSKTKAGRHNLDKLGIRYHTQHGDKRDITKEIRAKLTVPPLPKNMHPVHHEGRRRSRAKNMAKNYGRDKDAVFIDAARYKHKCSFVAAV